MQSPYKKWGEGLAAAAQRIEEEQAAYLGSYDHEANWEVVNDLIAAGLRNAPPMRTESGLVLLREGLERAARRGTGRKLNN